MALPFALKNYINRTLNGIEGYSGHVEDVDVALWRGSYQLQDIKIVKNAAKTDKPFFAADEVAISLDWPALFRGRLVSKITMYKPQIQFVEEASKEASQTTVNTKTWQRQLMKLYPFRINRFHIHDGFVRFENKTSNPKINIYAENLDLFAENISNASNSDRKLPSPVEFRGLLLHSGKLAARGNFNLLTEPTELDLNATMTDLNLKEINDFARAYGNFDFEKGKMNLALELAASKTNFKGYVKTALLDLKILDFEKERKEGDSIGHLLWEGLVATIADLFQNQKRHQFAARIPISGSRKEIKLDSWAAIGSILKNAFVKALSPDLEDSVQFSDAVRSGATSEDPAKKKP